jgi:hypothetical protein
MKKQIYHSWPNEETLLRATHGFRAVLREMICGRERGDMEPDIRCANDRCLLLASFCSSPKNECCLSLGTLSEPLILRKQAFEPQSILLVKVENQGHADTLYQLVPIPPSRLSAATQSVDTYQACGPHPN